MDKAIVFMFTCTLMLVCCKSYHIYYDDSYEEYDKEYINAKTLSYDKSETTTKTYIKTTLNTKARRYEVTENVVDIPDDRTRGPIVANYSIARVFNTANDKKAYETTKDNNKNEVKKNNINSLRVNAKSVKVNEANVPSDKKFNEFWTGIKEVFIGGINQVINKHKHPNLHNILSFLNPQKEENTEDDQFHKVFSD